MATTSAFGWSTPDDTALVKDGAAAIRTLGNSIDTSMAELKGGTTGQVLSKTSNTDMDFTWVAQDDSNAIQNALLTTTGDTIYASGASTPARLGIGSTGQVLTVAGGVPTWATASSGGMTLITSGTLSGATVTLSSIPSTYNNLQLVLTGVYPSNNGLTTRIDYNSSGIPSTGMYIGYNGSGTQVGGTQNNIELNPSGGFANTGANGVFLINFYDYARASVYRITTVNGRYNNGTSAITYTSTLQNNGNSAAISSLLIISNSSWSGGNYYLYGVK